MATTADAVSVKTVGSNGQISLGKQYAGRHVLIEEQEPGVWLVKTATVIPDNERWLHEPEAARQLAEAMEWAANNPASGENTDSILERLRAED
jgi:hypothetical protein